MRLAQLIQDFAADDSGSTAMEYSLLGTLIALGCIVAFTTLGNGLTNLFGSNNQGAGAAIEGAANQL